MIDEKNRRNQIIRRFKWKELKQEVSEEKDVSVHKTEVSVAEEFKMNNVAAETDSFF